MLTFNQHANSHNYAGSPSCKLYKLVMTDALALPALALQVTSAEAQVRAKVQAVQAPRHEVTMAVPQGMMGHVIGKAGSRIKAIASSSGAQLVVDPPGSETLLIRGTEQQVGIVRRL